MELQKVLQERRSIRKFTEEQVSAPDIEAMLHAAMSGPSACNKMPWEFYVVKNKAVLNQLHSASQFTNIQAPLAIVVCGSLSRTLPLQLAEYWVQDCSAATENILLCATDLGLGAVWCGIYPQKKAQQKVMAALSLTDKHIPLNIIYIGHPAQSAEPRDQYNEKRVHCIF